MISALLADVDGTLVAKERFSPSVQLRQCIGCTTMESRFLSPAADLREACGCWSNLSG